MSLKRFFSRSRRDAELAREIEEHIELETEENRARGLSPDQARRRAYVKLGSPRRVREDLWQQNTVTVADNLWRDLKYALRTLRRTPGFTLTAVLILALGIGANTAIFTLMNALLLRSLPVSDPSSLVRLTMNVQMDSNTIRNIPLNYPIIGSLSRRAKSFAGIFGWSGTDFVLSRNGVVRQYHGALVSGGAFGILGVRPALGRLLTPQDDQHGGGPDGWAAVVSHRFWTTALHGNPSVIGSQVNLNDHNVTIIGVAPAGFEGVIVAERPDFYLPLNYETVMNGKSSHLYTAGDLWLPAFARLRPGVTPKRAAAELTSLFPAICDEILPPAIRHLPFIERSRLVVESGRAGWNQLQPQYTQALLLLQCLVVVVLLICCANLSGLCLARAGARQKEFAIRGALGAAPFRLVRQVLVESLLLAIPGAALGVAFAWPAARLLVQHLGDRQVAQSLSTRPDATVLVATVLCSIACALFFGMAPAWQARRTSVEPILRQTARHSRRAGLRSVFIPIEVALSLVLVVIAGLLGSTLMRLRTQNPGFRTENVLFARADFTRLPLQGRDLVALYLRMLQRMEQVPGIQQASLAELTPLSGMIHTGNFGAAGQSSFASSDISDVGPHYFAAIGTPIVAGHDFSAQDTSASTCVVNEAAASRYFSTGAALGHTLRRSGRQMNTGAEITHDCLIVGVSANAKYDNLRDSAPSVVYYPIASDTHGLPALYFVLHAHDDAAALAAYKAVLHEMAPSTPEAEPITFAAQFDDSIARDQVLSMLSGFFAALALLLSGIGIYGLVAWTVTERTAEIGIRTALGATRTAIVTLVLRQVFILLTVGLVCGGVGAWFAAHSIRSFLFETAPGDPLFFILAATALALTAALAALLPARHAASVDPMQALRTE